MSQATKALLTRVRPEIEYRVRMAAASVGKTKSEFLANLLEQHFEPVTGCAHGHESSQETAHVS